MLVAAGVSCLSRGRVLCELRQRASEWADGSSMLVGRGESDGVRDDERRCGYVCLSVSLFRSRWRGAICEITPFAPTQVVGNRDLRPPFLHLLISMVSIPGGGIGSQRTDGLGGTRHQTPPNASRRMNATNHHHSCRPESMSTAHPHPPVTPTSRIDIISLQIPKPRCRRKCKALCSRDRPQGLRCDLRSARPAPLV